MAQSSHHSCSISSITQRLKRQSLSSPHEDGVAVPVRRPCELAKARSATRQRTTVKSNGKERTDGADENARPPTVVTPRPLKVDDRSPPKPSTMPPRPMQSAGLPSMSVRAFPTRDLSLSAHEPVLRPHRSPPLAPPLKRFCRSLTEDLPRPTPRRPAHANADYLRGLIARRLRCHRTSQPASPASSFSSSRSSFRRWTSSSGYSSSSSSLNADKEEERQHEPHDSHRRDFFHGGRTFLCGLPELQQRVSSPLPAWLQPEAASHNQDEEEEEEVTLHEDTTRWSSPCGLEGLDLDSMEKDDSWKL